MRSKGQLVRCTCTRCGAVEMRAGCTSDFHCRECQPTRTADSLQYQAHRAVAKAIKAGDLKHPTEFSCVDCAAPAHLYEHRDYTKPLEVQPVCRSCNCKRGSAIGVRELAKVA